MAVTIEVMNPVAEVRPDAILPAPRLDDLKGKKIALWWNNKPKGEIALTAVAEVLENRFPGLKCIPFFYHEGLLMFSPHGPEAYNSLFQSKPDAVIASTGD
ncbi:hypothetical protein ACFLWC_07910 [Chloroflexota bacterium]